MVSEADTKLTVDETAAIAGCHHQTVLRAIHSGDLPAMWNLERRIWEVRFGDARLFKPQAKRGRPKKLLTGT